MKRDHRALKMTTAAALVLCGILGMSGCTSGGGGDTETVFKKGEISQGDIVTFGSFEQDNDTSNGAEPIEWIVLNVDEDNNRALLLSKKALDTRQYHDSKGAVVRMTWSECDLRMWLNGEFYSDAFDSKEKNEIEPMLLENLNNPVYNTNGGEKTRDYVTLLSIEDVTDPNNGFSSEMVDDSARRCAATPYAVSRGMSTSSNYPTEDGEEGGVWWLRSVGGSPLYASVVIHTGDVSANGWEYGSDEVGVRPAVYVKLQ
ncbi:MAG: hypothetical protein J5825_11360 [Lachnospiraceae bacterium]|nr:hypothetical protein [Lachnospiraceae bacterium]